jgi:hypothetical protein
LCLTGDSPTGQSMTRRWRERRVPPGLHDPGGPDQLPEGDIALWRRARRRFYWLLTVVLIRLADRVPVFLGRRMCVGLAGLAMGLRRQDRRVAEVNLVRAFPELDDSGRNRLLQGATEAMGLNLFDTLAAGRLLGNEDSVVEESGSVSGIRRVGCSVSSHARIDALPG